MVWKGELHPRIAVKELIKPIPWDYETFRVAAQKEARTLRTMNDHPDPHLIKVIAYCIKGEKRYFLFPWAENGNLRQYWQNQAPSMEPANLEWIFVQLAGLAGALRNLHHMDCRHGDLKPENILCFGGPASSRGAEHRGRFVIADVGLAKVHKDATELRTGATTTMSATVMYSAPEIELGKNQARSRLYDIWCIGCIYLEFVIWLLFGRAGLLKFQEDIGGLQQRGTFYVIVENPRRAQLHPRAREWVESIKKDSRCVAGTAVARLIRLVADRLLVPALPGHKNADFAETTRTSGFDPAVGADLSDSHDSQQAPTFILERPTIITGGLEAAAGQATRASAKEMHEALQDILNDINSGDCEIIGTKVSREELPRPASRLLSVPSSRPSSGIADGRKAAVCYPFHIRGRASSCHFC